MTCFCKKRRQRVSGKNKEAPASQITKHLADLGDVQCRLLRYLENAWEKAEWIEDNVLAKNIGIKRFGNNKSLQSNVALKIIQIGQIVADMEVLFPGAEFWLEQKKESGGREAVPSDTGLPHGKLSFVDIKSCRNEHVHAIEIDMEQLYSDATEFIPSVARSINVIMEESFSLDQEDLKFLRSRKLTAVERLINIIDCDQQTGNVLKKALFDRIKGNDDFDTIRNLKREERLGIILAYENIVFSLNFNNCNRLYAHYEKLGEFSQFKADDANSVVSSLKPDLD